MTSRLLECAYRSLCFAAAIILALVIAYLQMTNTQMLTEDRVRLERHLDWTAERPFVWRPLIPESIRALVSVTPEPLLRAIERWGAPVGKKLLPPGMPATSRPIYYYYLALLYIGCLFLYGVLSRRLFEDLFGSNRFFGPLIPSIALFLLFPMLSYRTAHLYDFGVLAIMSALLHAMAAERHRLFLLLFAVSCFNKETTILITLAYAFYFFDRMPRRRFLIFVSIQLFLLIIIYGGLRYYFSTNPGDVDGVIEAYSTGKLTKGSDRSTYYLKEQFWWIAGRNFSDYSSFIILLLLISYCWREKPVFLRRTAVMLVGNAVLFIFACTPGEFRDFYESLPLLTLFVCRNLELLWRDWMLRGVAPIPAKGKLSAKQLEIPLG